jgi:hypothetical protein
MKGMLMIWLVLRMADASVNIDNKVSIIFPGSPERSAMSDKVYYMYSTDKFVYNAAYTDLKIDLHTTSSSEQQDKIYAGFIKGALDAATNSKLLSQRDIHIKKHPGREITYIKRFDKSDNVKIVKRIILLNKRLYQFELWALNGQMDQSKLDKFFNSIKINE